MGCAVFSEFGAINYNRLCTKNIERGKLLYAESSDSCFSDTPQIISPAYELYLTRIKA